MRRKSLTVLLILGIAFSAASANQEGGTHQADNFQNLQNDSQSTNYQACQDYFNEVNTLIAEKKSKLLPQTFKNTISMSGRSMNDMGQVDMCRETQNMTFVRMTMDIPNFITVYRGFCLDQVCNAAVLNANQNALNSSIQMIINTIKNQLTPPKPVTELEQSITNIYGEINILASSTIPVSYQPFEIDTQSKVNAAYIIAAISIISCIVVAFGSPILKAITTKKKEDKAKYQTLINYNQNGATMTSNGNDASTISKLPSGNDASTISATSTPPKPRKSPMYWRVLQCWNIQENFKKMFVLKSNNDDLLVFNGIRTICFMQVIFGHEFYLHTNYMNNPLDLMIEQNKPFILFAVSCLYSVDVFFYLGGFFLAYVVADEKMAKNLNLKKPVKVAMGFVFAIINRVFRILPCYFLVLMFYWKIIPYWGDSPTWDVFFEQSNNCDQRWWQNLLFIDNMFSGQHEKCFGWGWYLSNDFQMFIVGMILLIVYANNRKIGKLSIIASFAAVQTVSIVLSYKWNFKVPCNIVNLGVPYYYDDYYTKPWTRSPPYFVGLFMGVLYKEYQADKSKKTKRSLLMGLQKAMSSTYLKWVCYGLGFLIYGFLVFGPRYLQVNGLNAWPDSFQHFWFGSCRTFYVLAVTCFMVPGMLGSKDAIVKFFSSKIFAFIQRLSFCGYLTHYMIILYTIWQTRDSVYYDVENLISLFFSEFFLTLLAAGFVTLIIEIPIMNLSGILLGGRKPSSAAPVAKPIDVNDKEKQVFDINKSAISSEEGGSTNQQPLTSKTQEKASN